MPSTAFGNAIEHWLPVLRRHPFNPACVHFSARLGLRLSRMVGNPLYIMHPPARSSSQLGKCSRLARLYVSKHRTALRDCELLPTKWKDPGVPCLHGPCVFKGSLCRQCWVGIDRGMGMGMPCHANTHEYCAVLATHDSIWVCQVLGP